MDEQRPATDEDWSGLLRRALETAREALQTEATRRSVELRDLATTLICVVATADLVAALQVGDGASIVGDHRGDIGAVTTPQIGEYVNETTFITANDAMERVALHIWHGMPRHVAVFSDGLQLLSLQQPPNLPYPPFFKPLFDFIDSASDVGAAQDELTAFLASPRIVSRTDDDVTIVVAARRDSC